MLKLQFEIFSNSHDDVPVAHLWNAVVFEIVVVDVKVVSFPGIF